MKTHSQQGSKGTHAQRGGAMVLALIAVMAAAMLAAGFLQLSSAITRRQSAAVSTRQAFYLAEAGLAEAYMGLSVARTGNVGTEELPVSFGGGLFWVEATPVGDLEASAGWFTHAIITLYSRCTVFLYSQCISHFLA